MRERLIGEIIKEERRKRKITQEELCEDIYEPSTLSRIENNKQDPSRKKLQVLLQRLGTNDSRFYAMVSAKEVNINHLCDEIASYNVKYERSDENQKKEIAKVLREKHEELLKIIEPDDVITRQFIIKSQVLIDDSTIENKIDKLIEAIKLTHSTFDFLEIGDGLFSFDEIMLINQMAVLYSKNRDQMAIKIWEQLLKNIDDRFETIIPARTQKDLVLYGLSREYLIAKEYAKALRYAEEGRRVSIDYGIYQHLPGFTLILAECEYHLDEKNKSEEHFKDAYYLCRAIGDKLNKKIASDAYLEYFGICLS